ncbi:protein LURP-one-related 10 [Daucus carota subsp. sativus]|nr:PREDICTED: protein LURP-one-related 10-like [Daucus carota subsp. sativus]
MMTGQGSYMAPAEGNPAVAVVGQHFMVPYPVDLTIVRKMLTISEGNFGVTDANGNIMFQVKGKLLSFRDRRILLDAAGNPVLSLQQKMISLHNRWEVYRGDSKDSRDFLFTVKKSSLLQVKTQLDVFLASNTSEHNCDFKIKGSWFERSCTIYAGTTSTVIAQMHKKHSVSSIVLGKDKFAVTVYPHVDYAFIVALIVILEEINEARSNEGSSGYIENHQSDVGLGLEF